MDAAVRTGGDQRGWAGRAALLSAAGLCLAACATTPPPLQTAGTEGQPSPRYNGHKTGQPYEVRGVWYYPKEQPNYDEIGIASWYGEQFHNQYTADGEVFDMHMPSAAHKTLPLPSLVEVTNLSNGKKLIVRVNDRGPFVDGRVIDLSKEAAAELGFVTAGVTKVRVRYVGQAADPPGYDPRQEVATAKKAARAVQKPADLASARPPRGPIPYSQLAKAEPAAAPIAKAAPAPLTVPTRPPDIVDALLAEKPNPTVATQASYELQAGAFPSEAAARHFASGLTGGGLPEVQSVHEGAGLTWRVVVHGLANRTEAAAARSEAMALGAPSTTIVGGS